MCLLTSTAARLYGNDATLLNGDLCSLSTGTFASCSQPYGYHKKLANKRDGDSLTFSQDGRSAPKFWHLRPFSTSTCSSERAEAYLGRLLGKYLRKVEAAGKPRIY